MKIPTKYDEIIDTISLMVGAVTLGSLIGTVHWIVFSG